MTDLLKLEDRIRDCYRTWGERYYRDYYGSDTSYPPFHTDIIRNILEIEGAKTLLDAGCGPASMLRDLQIDGLERWGFDLTPEMIIEARRVLEEQGLPPDRLWEGSVLEAGSFKPPLGDAPTEGFDAAICFGVLPHIPSDGDVIALANLRDSVRPGGVVAVEARNELFGLFTLNRYSRALFRDRLVKENELLSAVYESEKNQLTEIFTRLDEHFHMDLPPLRKGYEDEPGYDEVLSRTHNPFELSHQAETLGLIDVKPLFYHFHALPPIYENHAPALFRRASIAMEKPDDWRGHFMASAFVLIGRRPL